MSDKYVWRVVVTDAEGQREPSAAEALPNPYVSDEPAQHVAERVLSLVVPGYAAREPAATAVEVGVWLGRQQGDPIAVAEWHHGP
ncbi:hypothetical protein [Streptacidiphilus sp. P02-A3a]|uniref:hypothetical protein n=1 Tax=Streptacidiphilus sp. P02-A3a TaxID=2704468 RepID=UPI0015FDE8AF|nr:hypothetical protein [Streptacidiphilus sp. P02-A3a]QMU70554.1 hypothetical protein GXP74_22490 [Streptacidiphilus sp. P02-A3a]